VTQRADLIPEDEAERIAAVRRYDVLDTPPDGAFERLTALAAKHFRVPIAIVSIVDSDRIWFASHHGLDAQQIGRDPGLCASAILQDAPWVVENAATDPRTMANPLVAGELGLRFYAGAPLTTHDGHNLGTLCVIDAEPREFPDDEAATLADMAAIVMDELELRLAARRTIDHESLLRGQAESMASALQQSLLPPRLPELAGTDVAALYRPADASVVGGDFYDVFETGERVVLVVGDVSGKGHSAAALTALARHTIRTAALGTDSPSEMLRILNRSMFIGREEADIEHFATVLIVIGRREARGLSLCAAAAGHPPGLVVRVDGETGELGDAGPPIGWYREASFTQSAVTLHAGDALVLFTDGITEARTLGGMLGSEDLAQRLRAHAGDGAAALIGCIERLLAGDEVEVRDDVAAVAIQAR
jgi:sigma-B regulation protein RsbU (phosphoserine phosphatase)